MHETYCLSPLGSLYRSTWFGGLVASPKDKKDYPGITINSKLYSELPNTLTITPLKVHLEFYIKKVRVDIICHRLLSYKIENLG